MTATSNPRSSGSAEVRHVNYQSDFRVVFSFPNNALPQYPWRLELSTPNTPGYNVFLAWFDGENYHNCKPQEDGTLLVPVDNHDLAPGVLTYKINIDDADADFPDGFMNVTIPGTLAVELWAGPSDEFAGEIGVVVLPVKGDPGPGVASGGKTGQMLAKQSDADYDTVWVDPTSTPTINIVQTTGQSEADVMSQKAVTDALDKKVDAEEGKGLSSNDYTNLDKNKVASAVLFSPQTLTPQQQEQARANIGSAPKYYDKNGFVISPLGLKVIGLRYIGFKEVSGDTTCYILTVSRCLKFDFKTFEVFWDVAVPGATDSWHKSSVSMRIIGDEVYIAQANWNIFDTGFNLIRLNDTDGSPIEQKEIPVAMKYGYNNILTAGDILLTSSAVYALDTNLKKIVKCDIETLEITELSDESSDLYSGSTRNLPWWITNEYGERELVIVNFLPKVNKIHLTRDNGSTIEITVSGISNLSNSTWCIYIIDLVSNLLHIQSDSLIYEAKIIKEDDAHYTSEFISIADITLKYRDFCRNSLVNYDIKQSNFILRPDHPSLMMPFDLTGKKDSAYFVSNKTGIALIADHICASDTNSLSNIDIWAGI